MKSKSSISSRFPLPRLLQRFPFWLGAIIISFVPMRILAIIDYLASPSAAIGSLFLDTGFVLSFLIIYFLYAMRYISRRLDRLSDYVAQMSPETLPGRVAPSYRWSRVLVVWLATLGVNTVLFPTPTSLAGVFAEAIPVFAYFFLILAALLYVYGSSMLAIYRAGKLPLKLKPFTEDRTLGLKPFGTTSLRLTSVYAILPIVATVLPLVNVTVEFPGGVTFTPLVLRPSDIIFTGGLVLIGVALFFVPLIGIHRRLLEEKRHELDWITPRYTLIVQRLKDQAASSPQSENIRDRQALADELTIVRQLQADIHRIMGWPFDLGVMTRLATVLALPPLLGVVARILILTFLHI